MEDRGKIWTIRHITRGRDRDTQRERERERGGGGEIKR